VPDEPAAVAVVLWTALWGVPAIHMPYQFVRSLEARDDLAFFEFEDLDEIFV
jgi:hypothetical protein